MRRLSFLARRGGVRARRFGTEIRCRVSGRCIRQHNAKRGVGGRGSGSIAVGQDAGDNTSEPETPLSLVNVVSGRGEARFPYA